MSESLQLVGRCDARLFGITPAQRLARQRLGRAGPLLIADASAVLSDAALAWLLENPGQVLTTPAGTPAAVAVDADQTDAGRNALGGSGGLPLVNPAQLPPMFVRKLRRRDRLLVRRLDEQPAGTVGRELFANVYKGVTDLVTKYVWPWPAYWVTRACAALSIHPNAVTGTGILLMFAAAFFWLSGDFALGLACAWLMTFLDTVDGKLARVTVTSSSLGNKLDHVTDVVHPPFWWVCLALGIADRHPAATDELAVSAVIILVTYVIGRLVESAFKKTIGYNAYLWQRFDSLFRLVVARRNSILLIVSAGVASGLMVEAFAASAAWSVVSAAIQVLRFVQARQAMRSGRARSWLM